MAWVSGVVALQLIGLILVSSSLNCNGEGFIDDNNHKITLVKTPPPPPPPPASAPPPPPREQISAAVEGVVYCMSCKLPLYDPKLNASPLLGATAKLVCSGKNGVTTVNGNATTCPKGYFFIQVQNRRPSTVGACKVQLTLPSWCNKPVYPEASGGTGFPVRYEKAYKVGTSRVALFTTGFLEFGPANAQMCPRPRP